VDVRRVGRIRIFWPTEHTEYTEKIGYGKEEVARGWARMDADVGRISGKNEEIRNGCGGRN
jgi:hypothetical protein